MRHTFGEVFSDIFLMATILIYFTLFAPFTCRNISYSSTLYFHCGLKTKINVPTYTPPAPKSLLNTLLLWHASLLYRSVQKVYGTLRYSRVNKYFFNFDFFVNYRTVITRRIYLRAILKKWPSILFEVSRRYI